MKSLFFMLLLMNYSFANNPVQLFNTSLTVTVRDELGNTVEGVSVKIFEKEDDFNKEVNAIEVAMTDKKGIAKFKKLKPESYFILCRKGDKDNINGGEKTVPLTKGNFNKTTIVIQ